MKDLVQFIKESTESKFTKEELHKDYEDAIELYRTVDSLIKTSGKICN